MFSKELEEIIEAVLADGEITDKERAVLHRRAMAEGIDIDEFDIIINGRLVKRNAEKERQMVTPPRLPSNKHGEIRKCPNCGAVVEPGNPRCDECGYAFVGLKANSSREKLQQILAEIERRHSSNLKSVFFPQGRISELDNAINTFPIPTTKEDLLEFIMFLEPLASNWRKSENQNGPAYKSKYKECIKKAEFYFSDDPMFKKILEKKDEAKPKGGVGKLFGKK